MIAWTMLVAAAQDAPSLDDVLRAVDSSLPLIAAAEQDIRRAEGALLEARGAFDLRWDASGAWAAGDYGNTRLETGLKQPTTLWGLDAWAKYKLGVGDFASYDGGYQPAPGQLAVGVDVPLWRDGPIDRERAALRSADLGVDGAQARWESVRINARRDATIAWYTWAAAASRRELALTQLRIAEDRAAGIAARVTAGDLPGLENRENDRIVAERAGALAAADRDLRQAALTLSLYWRDAEGRPIVGAPDRAPTLPPPPAAADPADPAALVERGWTQRPELRDLDVIAAQADVRADQAANRRAPRVDLQASVARDLGPDPYVPIEGRVGLVLGLEVQQRAARGAVAVARAEASRAERQTTWLRDQIQAQVLTALASRDAAVERWRLAAENAALAREIEAAVSTDFRAGGATVFEVFLREQNTALAVRAEIDAALDYHAAVAQLRAALGE